MREEKIKSFYYSSTVEFKDNLLQCLILCCVHMVKCTPTCTHTHSTTQVDTSFSPLSVFSLPDIGFLIVLSKVQARTLIKRDFGRKYHTFVSDLSLRKITNAGKTGQKLLSAFSRKKCVLKVQLMIIGNLNSYTQPSYLDSRCIL